MRSRTAQLTVLLAATSAMASASCGEPFSTEPPAGGAAGAATTSTNSGGGATGAGGGDGGTLLPSECHPPQLEDDFSATGINGELWTPYSSDVAVNIENGRLRLSPKPDTPPSPSGELQSLYAYDLGSCSTWVEVPTVLPTTTAGSVAFKVRLNAANYAEICTTPGGLGFRFVVGADGTDHVMLPYDSSAHRWWRFRDDGAISYLDTSPDGVSWTMRHQAPTPFELSAVKVVFSVAVWEHTGSDPGVAEFDNVNLVP